jgi:hypothetical protein
MRRFIILLLALWATGATAQNEAPILEGIGFRFASDFNWFHLSENLDLVDSWYSTGVFGVFYRVYAPNRGIELGLNINYKDGDGKGFPNLPIIMTDFDNTNTQSVGMTALELDLKVGPRFGGVHPKIGYILGYRLRDENFLEAGSTREINGWYFQLPFGCSVALPTTYGSVGFGATFELDLTNVIKNDTSQPGSSFRGGRQHAINLEISLTFDRY